MHSLISTGEGGGQNATRGAYHRVFSIDWNRLVTRASLTGYLYTPSSLDTTEGLMVRASWHST